MSNQLSSKAPTKRPGPTTGRTSGSIRSIIKRWPEDKILFLNTLTGLVGDDWCTTYVAHIGLDLGSLPAGSGGLELFEAIVQRFSPGGKFDVEAAIQSFATWGPIASEIVRREHELANQ